MPAGTSTINALRRRHEPSSFRPTLMCVALDKVGGSAIKRSATSGVQREIRLAVLH
jgi:hypothetical protein